MGATKVSTIEKKIWPEFFEKVLSGEKTYELRLADWECSPGDTLLLKEWDPKTREFTGRELKKRVGCVGKTKDFDFWTKEEVDKYGYQIISLLDENKLPVIRIKNAWLLRENASKHLHELWGKDKKLADDKWIEKRVGEYRKAWQPFEQKILTGMTKTLGLSFRQNIIDVNIAPWFNAFSDPMVIGVMQEPDVFVDTLTHELLHRLLTDNTTIPHETQLLSEWQKLFGKQHSFGMVVHIPVHAVHKAIYLDVLKAPKRLERDIASNRKDKATDYIGAWDYVEKHNYKEIIGKLKKSYRELAHE
ncbi:MAG: DUF3850 domain-containing protein [Candidatus Saccharimonadales bacterium]